MPEQTELDKQLEKQYQRDLKDLVDTYRTAKRAGTWIAGIFAFMLVITSILLTIKELLKK